MSVPICKEEMEYLSLFGLAQLCNQALSVMIVIQSYLARSGFIQLTKLIHFTSNSQRMCIIVVSVFSIFFLNYGLLYIVAPFKWDIPALNAIIFGIYEDFN